MISFTFLFWEPPVLLYVQMHVCIVYNRSCMQFWDFAVLFVSNFGR